jgi:hypothetical protein
VRRLERFWCSYLIGCQDWETALALSGLELCVTDDLSDDHRVHFTRLLNCHDSATGPVVDPDELSAWKLAVELSDAGLLGYKRFVAVATPGYTCDRNKLLGATP